MLDLTTEEKLKIDVEEIKKQYVRKYNLSSGTYYAKYCSEDEVFRELIGKEVFDMGGIKCPEYYYIKEKRCLVSEDLHNLNGFMYMSEIPEIKKDVYWRRITLDIVKKSLSEIINNKEELELEINIMHFIDVLFSNIDRHLNNYGISIDENNICHISVFDNGMFIENLDCVTKPMACSVTNKKPKYQECEYFIKNLKEEHKKYIYEIFKTFTPKTLMLIMNKIERENNYKFHSKNKILYIYIKNYLRIYTIIQKTINEKIKSEVLKKCKK